MAEVAVTKVPGLLRPMFPLGNRLFGAGPFALMRELTREMDEMFEPLTELGAEAVWSPAIECKRKNGEMIVSAELPGMKKEEVKVELSDGSLIVEGERKREEKVEKEGYFRSERSYGKFFRRIALPEGAKTDQIKAELSNGVLEVHIPVPESKAKTREIPIK